MKTAKIFRNGQSQAVRLPKEFRFGDTEVFIKKTGNIVQLIPRTDSWNNTRELSRIPGLSLQDWTVA